MYLVEHTRPYPAENLALDEALVELAENAARPLEILRLWEPSTPMVVVGRSSHAAQEVRLDHCRRQAIPVFRRASGGATVVIAPGCLMYALVLSYDLRPDVRMIDRAHRLVLETLVAAIRPLANHAMWRGTCDLAVDGRKFSGNSLRCRRRSLLYHGTLLYDFPIELVDRCLGMPPRMPDYRQDRPHSAFLTNLPVEPTALRGALKTAWRAAEPLTNLPLDHMRSLVAEKYDLASWNLRH